MCASQTSLAAVAAHPREVRPKKKKRKVSSDAERKKKTLKEGGETGQGQGDRGERELGLEEANEKVFWRVGDGARGGK